jgi:hypothetical protein
MSEMGFFYFSVDNVLGTFREPALEILGVITMST